MAALNRPEEGQVGTGGGPNGVGQGRNGEDACHSFMVRKDNSASHISCMSRRGGRTRPGPSALHLSRLGSGQTEDPVWIGRSWEMVPMVDSKSSPHHMLCSEGEETPKVCRVIFEAAETLALSRVPMRPRRAGNKYCFPPSLGEPEPNVHPLGQTYWVLACTPGMQ